MTIGDALGGIRNGGLPVWGGEEISKSFRDSSEFDARKCFSNARSNAEALAVSCSTILWKSKSARGFAPIDFSMEAA